LVEEALVPVRARAYCGQGGRDYFAIIARKPLPGVVLLKKKNSTKKISGPQYLSLL
jgi:hypothetical protein